MIREAGKLRRHAEVEQWAAAANALPLINAVAAVGKLDKGELW
jgi:hypothetical protein